jgi:hypothetical protein
LKDLLSDTVSTKAIPVTPSQGVLFRDIPAEVQREIEVGEERASFATPQPHVDDQKLKASPENKVPALTVYDAVLPLILEAVRDWKHRDVLAEELDVQKPQLDKWLKRAVGEGKLEKKTRPAQYRRSGA